MDLKRWTHIGKSHRPVPLSSSEYALWAAVARWRALLLKDVRLEHDDRVIISLMALDELYLVPTLVGTCVMLGPAGRARAGQRPDNRPSVDSVMNAAYMARAVADLKREGWLFKRVSERGRGHYLMTDNQGRDWTVIGQARGYTPRTLRRIIRELRVPSVIRGDGILIVTPDQRRTYGVARKNDGLIEVRTLKLAQLERRRSHREAVDPITGASQHPPDPEAQPTSRRAS